MSKLSVVLATRNEEENIGRCLEAVKSIADEIIVLDEYSTDKTVEIAKRFGAKVYEEPHHDIFHITKQKAIDKAKGDWVLQLDADEVVTPELAREISDVINMTDKDMLARKPKDIKKQKLFERHTKLISKRDGGVGSSGKIAAFFIPRKNIFLGEPLVHAGVYPDPAIRLIRKGKARLPGKSVHEIMEVDGKVLWLFNDMLHYDSPNLTRYIDRLNRYTDLFASELKDNKVRANYFNLLNYSSAKPFVNFIKLYIVHRGYLDGMRGFVWSVFSSLHFPIAYFKYYSKEKS